ncbi:MAG: hypothetical protein V1684_01550 [bacterium]
MKKNKNKKCQPHPKAGAAQIKTSLGVMIILLFFVGVLGWLMSAM